MRRNSLLPMTRAEVRQYDADAIARGVPGIVLMENAGRGVADWMEEIGMQGPVGIVCGKGNNGGDGFVIARQLQSRGYEVRVALLVEPGSLTADAAIAWRAMEGLPIPRAVFDGDPNTLPAAFQNCDWIVDAMLGTGLAGEVREPFATAIRVINEFAKSCVNVMAVDLPSGMDCDSGEPNEPTVRANYTATFVAPKVGFAAADAKPFLGEVRVLDIGAGRVV